MSRSPWVPLFVVCASVVSGAQKPPDFSGTWVLQSGGSPSSGVRPGTTGRPTDGRTEPSGARGADRSLSLRGLAFDCGAECTIRQTPRAITITRLNVPKGLQPPRVVLTLDGKVSWNEDVLRVGEPPVKFAALARWDGATLVTVRSVDPKDPEAPYQAIRSLALEDGRLIITATVKFPDSVASGPIVPQRRVYVRR
jgi:hypothetical protein